MKDMPNPTVKFVPHNITLSVSPGTVLLRAALEAGVHVNASCGGEGACGKCRVMIEQGQVEGGVSEKLSDQDREEGFRLACRSRIYEDLVIRVPVESSLESAVLNRKQPPRQTAQVRRFDIDELKEQGLFIPPIEKRLLDLPPPSAKDNLADVTRLVSFLKARYNEHRLVVDLPVIRKTPDILRQDNFRVTATLARPVRPDSKTRVINIQGGDTTDRNYAVAMDIGTTTIYGQVINLADGQVLGEHGEFNGQISYGEDVITRIVYGEKPGGLQKLHEVVIATMNRVIRKILRQAKVDPDEISTITLAGNTTMTQLMLKINPRYVRLSPYVPASTLFPPIPAAELGIALGDHVEALIYPVISSYVGGDIVAGVMSSGIYRTDKVTLFMDIGTNAEIVIGNRSWLACAACSAGPAFEGGGITFGMHAAKGAIEDLLLDPQSFEPMIITIGDVRAKGICGSGLINIVALLFEMGLIDSRGKFRQDLDTPRIRVAEGVYEYVLAWAEETQINRDITLTEIDIANLIRAKGAIFSGCRTLLEEVGLSLDDIEQVILAGGFGSYVDLQKAMTIGLLPEMDPNKITYVGNSSLMGCRMSSLTNRIRRDVVDVTKRMTNFELSETPSYMDHYTASLFLPHTDMRLFPNLEKRLGSLRNNRTDYQDMTTA
ncbi:MAG: ASKHA domain-containing protein [Thermodesulfobacteriota bacterium]|nr:ASKHA domain-containing protein [Thermodesulfobacteriota bacterium]